MDRAALVAKLREQIEALQRIVPADLEGDEAYYRNGEYVRLSDVLSLLTAEPTTDHASARALVQTWQAEDATAKPERPETPQLGQAWVSKVTSAEGPELSVMGGDVIPMPPLPVLLERLKQAATETDVEMFECWDEQGDYPYVLFEQLERWNCLLTLAVEALGAEPERRAPEDDGLCRNGSEHYCPNCDNTFRAR